MWATKLLVLLFSHPVYVYLLFEKYSIVTYNRVALIGVILYRFTYYFLGFSFSVQCALPEYLFVPLGIYFQLNMCLVAAIQCSLFLLYIRSVCVTFKNRSREFVSWQPNFYQKFEIFTKQSAVPVLAKIRQVACRHTRLIRLTFTDCLQIGRFKIVRRFSYDISTYCALFDKSTKFGTEVNRYNMSKSGCGAIGQLPSGGRGAIFQNGRQRTPENQQKLDKVCCWRF